MRGVRLPLCAGHRGGHQRKIVLWQLRQTMRSFRLSQSQGLPVTRHMSFLSVGGWCPLPAARGGQRGRGGMGFRRAAGEHHGGTDLGPGQPGVL
ncbi:hypothetical protein D7M15_28135 [Streptomyces sp. Z26]|nr:hypothetical protein D7M15_28135 [Streptomyces sp. Z26]